MTTNRNCEFYGDDIVDRTATFTVERWALITEGAVF